MLRMQESRKTDQFNIKTATFKTFSFRRKVQRARVTVTGFAKDRNLWIYSTKFRRKKRRNSFSSFFSHTNSLLIFCSCSIWIEIPRYLNLRTRTRRKDERCRCVKADTANGQIHPSRGGGEGQRDFCLRRGGFINFV